MDVFLSYASQHKERVRPVCASLRAAGFGVFFDETDLPPGDSYDDRIREAVQRSDLFLFMLSPEAVTPGRYTLTELLFAQTRWPNPRGRVLAVLPLDTPEPPLPDYLKALTLQKQVGNLPAEVLATVRRMEAALSPAAAVSTPPAPMPSTPSALRPSEGPVDTRAATYQTLDIRFRQTPNDGYMLSLAGAAQSDDTPLPADPAALERALWDGAEPVAGVVRRGEVPSLGPLQIGTLPSAEAIRQVGQRLHQLLFTPALREVLREPLRRIDRQRGQGLRFVIDTTNAPALARLPWEFTCDPQRREFLFADTMKPVVRWLEVDETLPTLTVQPPLRLLIAVASPTDQPALSVGEELAHLDRALAEITAQGLLRTELLEHASLARLDQALLESRPHVLHFVGHGGFTGTEGTVLFEDDDPSGTADAVTGQRLAVLLRNHLKSLRLVFLNSCMGAAASTRDPFGGVAQALVGYGVPAVIAMQFPIPDAAATALARHFYRYLASGRPVDESLTAARAMLFAQGHEVEWGAPVLTMRAPDGRLFDIAESRPWAAMPVRTGGPPQVEPLTPEPMSRPERAVLAGSRQPSVQPESLIRRAGDKRWLVMAAMVLVVIIVFLPELRWLWHRSGSVDIGSTAPSPSRPSAVPDALETTLRDALRQSQERLAAGDTAAALTAQESVLLPFQDKPLFGMPPALARDLRNQLSRLAEAVNLEDFDRLLSLAKALGDSELQSELITRMMDRFPPAAGSDGPGPVAHIVRRGETLWSIARLRYGDPLRWRAILEANPLSVGDPKELRIGIPLRIPPHPSTAVDSTYLVRPGDSLWRIAARLYGDGRQWPRIHAANARTVADPQRIEPGGSLRIPAAR